MRRILADFYDAQRSLRHGGASLAFAVVAIAVGVGATTAIWSVVDTALVRPLPYPEADRLAMIGTVFSEDLGGGRDDLGSVSSANFVDVREQATTLDVVVATTWRSYTMLSADEPRLVGVAKVSEGFFDLLGGKALLGRVLTAEDHAAGASRVAVLSHALWQSAWGGDPSIIGRNVTLSSDSYLVVGVVTEGFRPPEALRTSTGAELWTPIGLASSSELPRTSFEHAVIGRLAPGATFESADAEVDAIHRLIMAGMQPPIGGRVVSLREHTIGDIRRTLVVLLAAAVFLLLIACTNVANLLLSRGIHRQRELALRSALGARRSRVVRLLLAESILLAIAGGALGATLAHLAVGLFQRANPGGIPRLAEAAVDGRVLGFALLATGTTGMLFGLVPALETSRINPAMVLREGAAGLTGGRSTRRLRSALVVAQSALALILLVGAGLLVNSFVRLASVDPGFDPANLVALEVRAPGGFDQRHASVAFFNELLERVDAIPGVQRASLSSAIPYTPAGLWALAPEGWDFAAHDNQPPMIRTTWVSDGHLANMRIPLRTGRAFGPEDRSTAPAAAIVNEAFIREYWPDERDAIGKRIGAGFGPFSAEWLTVIGVVGDVRAAPERGPDPEVFILMSQQPWQTMNVVVRTTGDTAALAPAMRRAVWAVDPNRPIRRTTTMAEITSDVVAGPRFYTLLLSVFAGTAITLALLGVYGTAVDAAGRRTHEVGIRMALGAKRSGIRCLILRDGLLLAILGVAVGAAGALATSRLLSGFLFGVTTTDASTFAVSAALFLVTSGLASWIPAYRAARVDPTVALRIDR